jgi:hypothetical protein
VIISDSFHIYHFGLQTTTILWNVHIIHRPAQRRLVVLLTGVQPSASDGRTETYLEEWAIENERYAVAGLHAVHVVLVDNPPGRLRVFINGRDARFLRSTAAGLSEVDMYVIIDCHHAVSDQSNSQMTMDN